MGNKSSARSGPVRGSTKTNTRRALAQRHAPCADKEVIIQTKDLQFQDARQNFYDLNADPVSPTLERVKEDDKFAAYSKTFITRISTMSCALRDQAHHLEVKP